MLLLLAPSKTQEKIPYPHQETTTPELLNKSISLIKILRRFGADEIASLMKTSDKLTKETMGKIAAFTTPFTRENSHPAIYTFRGDSYSSLAPQEWDKQQRKYAKDHLVTLSGLYGILRPFDLMQPYRLEMGLKFTTEEGSTLYQFWGSSITKIINTLLSSHQEKTVINLSSGEYSKVVQTKELHGTFIDIVFKQKKDGTTKTIPIYSKRARGAMANFAITKQLGKSEQLKAFCMDGYAFNAAESTEAQFVFTCNLD